MKNLFKGRIGRKNYFLGNVFLSIISGILFSIFGSTDSIFLIGLFLVVGLVAYLVVGISLIIRRLHDLGIDGWWFVLMFIPIINIFFSLMLLFKKGENMVNDFGNIPSKNKEFFDDIRVIFNLNNKEIKNQNDNKIFYCHKCGGKVEIDSKFCVKCGEKNVHIELNGNEVK